MTGKPPREGSRWGDDPVPIVDSPRMPESYVRLCQKYGEANVQKVFAIQQQVMHEYPYLQSVQNDRIIFAEAVLQFAQESMELAAQDGRPHTMPETLELGEKFLGGLLAKNPQWTKVEKFTVTYGDENKGTAATAAAEKAAALAAKAAVEAENGKVVGQIAVMVVIPSLLVGWVAAEQPGGYDFGGAFFLTAIIVFVGIMILGFIIQLFE